MKSKCNEPVRRNFSNLFNAIERCNKCFNFSCVKIGYSEFIIIQTNSLVTTLKYLDDLQLNDVLYYISDEIDYQDLIEYQFLETQKIIYIEELECTY